MKSHAEKAEVKKIRVHDLRHSHCAYLINQGVQPIIIKENITIKVIAIKEGYQNSEVVTFSYTIAPKVVYTIQFDKNSEKATGIMSAQTFEEEKLVVLNNIKSEEFPKWITIRYYCHWH